MCIAHSVPAARNKVDSYMRGDVQSNWDSTSIVISKVMDDIAGVHKEDSDNTWKYML